MVSNKSLEKFKEIYKKRFGIELSNQDTLKKAIKCLRLVELVYKPITKEDYDSLQKRRKETGDIN